MFDSTRHPYPRWLPPLMLGVALLSGNTLAQTRERVRLTSDSLNRFMMAMPELQATTPLTGAQAEVPSKEFSLEDLKQFSSAIDGLSLRQVELGNDIARRNGFGELGDWAKLGDRMLVVALFQLCRKAATEPDSLIAKNVLKLISTFGVEDDEVRTLNEQLPAQELLAGLECPGSASTFTSLQQ